MQNTKNLFLLILIGIILINNTQAYSDTKPENKHERKAAEYLKNGLYDQALEEYNKAIQVEPDSPLLYFLGSEVHYWLKDYPTALKLSDKALSLGIEAFVDKDRLKRYFFRRASIFTKLKRYEQSIDAYKRAIEIDPEYVYAYYALGTAYWKMQDWEKVIEAWEEVLRLNPYHEYVNEWLPKAKRKARNAR